MHRWRIDEPNGEFSTGKCLLCGAEQRYRNAAKEDRPEEGLSGQAARSLERGRLRADQVRRSGGAEAERSRFGAARRRWLSGSRDK